MRNKYTYPINTSIFINKLLFFSEKYTYFSLLTSSEKNHDKYSNFHTIAAFESVEVLKSVENSFENLLDFHTKHKDWLFGYLSYDLKNELEDLTSRNLDFQNFAHLEFFVPETIFFIKDNCLVVESFLPKEEMEYLIEKINNTKVINKKKSLISMQFRESKEEYIDKINKIKSHIQLGDIYEINYCQELYSDGLSIDPSLTFFNLHNKSDAPFSVFSKFNENYLLCSSPERYLKKINDKIISQPIKGTRKRGLTSYEDNELKEQLRLSQKDRSENIMITDLVRSDLSKTSKRSSVIVEELCEIYSFERVHQMISTISSKLDINFNFVDVLKTTFPMGSMTGAPKLKSMELIEKFETTKRSLFSGSFGYITPDFDFDFNVVIRSILYNALNRNISVMVGGAITINSNPDDEYEESLIKAKAMIEVLEGEK